MTRTTIRALVLTALALALLAPAAGAATRNEILRDCAIDGKLDGRYSAKELRDARSNMPTDSDEYSDCRDQLRAAELGAAGGGGAGTAGASGGSGGGTTSGGAPREDFVPDGRVGGDTGSSPASGVRPSVVTPQTPDESKAIRDAARGGGAPIDVGDRVSVVPGRVDLSELTAVRDVPAPLLAVVALLAAATTVLAVSALRSVVRRRRA